MGMVRRWRRLSVISRSKGGGAPLNNDTAAQLVIRVGNLEEQNRELQGKVDELTNQLQQQNANFAKQLSDLQFKLGQGSGGQGLGGQGLGGQAQAGQDGGNEPAFAAPDEAAPMGTMGAPAPSPRVPPPARTVQAPPPSAVRRTPEMALHEGNAALARLDYAGAAASAREVLASHGVRSGDAQFLLARAESGQHQYPARRRPISTWPIIMRRIRALRRSPCSGWRTR